MNHDEKPDEKPSDDTTDKTWKEISEYIHGSSLLEIYMNASSVITDNEILNFKIRQICIKTGLNLLPIYDKNLDESEKEELRSFYYKAKGIIKKMFPKSRRAEYSFEDMGDKKVDIYQITSDDEDEINDYDSRPEDVYEMIRDYRRNQYEHYSMELEDIDNEIRHLLTKYDIIPRSNPDLEIDKNISNMLQDLFKKQVEKLLKEQDKHAQ